MTLLVTGGSGCGKSAYAERVMEAVAPGEKVYIATMRADGEEGARRVARHRLQRAGKGYRTVECPLDLCRAGVRDGEAVLLECLPNLVANEMFDGGDVSRILPALRALAGGCRHLVIVTQDVFCDAERYGASTRAYMRALAALNAEAARLCDSAVEVVYSIPVVLKGEDPCASSARCASR
ncbi:MAG: bifunctional adenosylcobinamide kinase/adenosylcobinamide-phosphate guanylyltransferase [Clostridia bacterium]|nr:bifunctional adenosylcobinamide kinase/adenosylcobinamide-phosphate guanylyltransferase [Clostridia bacterium]